MGEPADVYEEHGVLNAMKRAAPDARVVLRHGDEVFRLRAYSRGDEITWQVRTSPRFRARRWEVGIWNDRLGWRVEPLRRLVLARPESRP